MKILLVGGSGYIGTVVSEHFLKNKNIVHILIILFIRIKIT